MRGGPALLLTKRNILPICRAENFPQTQQGRLALLVQLTKKAGLET